MAARLPDGATVSLATTYGTLKNITAISNANPGNATSAAHGFSNGDILSVVSGWSRLNNRVVRVANSLTNSYDLDGIDTTLTSLFPAGSGVGSAQPITAFTQIAQILEFTTSGGDQQFANFSFLEQDFESQIPTITSAMSITIGIADDPSLAGYQALKNAAASRAIRALKLQLPDGSFILYQGYVSFNETPTVTKGQVMQVKATISLQSRPVRYAS
jgi:hypothetical protein